jgi:Regulator of chromosome condensation (RCC1) repeat
VNAPLLQWDSVTTAEASWNGGCALRVDGRVRCWGTNMYGDIVDRAGPYVQLSGRYTHFCALTPAGSAECWGDNTYNQARDHAGPYVQVVVGAQHSCALRPDGSVECWGRNQYGQLTTPSGTFTKLTSGAYTSCGIRVNGDVACWGNNSGGQGGVTAGPFIDVSAGTDHVCAVRRDRSLHCWGSTSNGQTAAPAGSYVALDAGTYHTCALATDGHAACWGLNNHAQSVTAAGPFVMVTAAREHSCGVSVSGAVECFGNADSNRTVGLPGGSVQVGLRYPVTGDATFEWSSVIAESRLHYADAPIDSLALPPAPRFAIPDAVWSALAASAHGEEFAFTIQRHTGDRLLNVVERVASFSESPLTGKIVYQSYGTRTVLNTVGTYEDPGERWGAAVFAYDARNQGNSVVAGFSQDTGASGAEAGCRGCHSVGASNHLLLAGIDNQREAALFAFDDPTSVEEVLPNATREHGGALWAAVHPTLPIAFSSRGPSPCAVAWDGAGSCATSLFASSTGELAGGDYLLQSVPGAMVGAAWYDQDDDGIYESASANQFLDLTAGNPGATVGLAPPDGLRAAMPVFSPEGDRVAFVHYSGDIEDGVGTLQPGDKRSLGMMDFDGEAIQLYNFQRITSEADAPCDTRFDAEQACSDVWPSFLPQGKGVVFQRQLFGNGGVANTAHSDLGGTRSGCEAKDQLSCNDGAKGELWWVALDSDGQPTGKYRLQRASGIVNSEHLVTDGASTTPGVGHSNEVESVLNYQPSVAPKTYGPHNWVAFTSRRAYGNVATKNPWWSDVRTHALGHDVATKKLWVSALDANVQADDPSAPAFYLEGQESRGSNGRPVWVSDSCIEPSDEIGSSTQCLTDADCCGAPDAARCEVELPLAEPAIRHCVPVDEEACVLPDSARLCKSDDECCGFADGERCMSGRCSTPPPLARYTYATFVRDYQAECPDGTLPKWKFLEWQALLPGGTSVQFDAATAVTKDELDDAEMIYQATASPPDTVTWTTWGTEDADSIDAKLAAKGYPSMEWLRVWVTLIPDESQEQTPVLETWRLVYDCADAL